MGSEPPRFHGFINHASTVDPEAAAQPSPVSPAEANRHLRGWSVVATAALAGLIALGLIITSKGRGKVLSAPASHAAASRSSKSPAAPLESVVNSIGMTLKLIPPGEFDMGTSPEQRDLFLKQFPGAKGDALAAEQPRHHVRITRAFYLGATEVTRGQFARFVQSTTYRTDAERDEKGGQGFDSTQREEGFWVSGPKYTWRDCGFPQANDHPVVNVTWNDAVAFCEWLSCKEGIEYRLPTEAEWEYACRAGTDSLYTTGDDPEAVATVGNLADRLFRERFPAFGDPNTKVKPSTAARDGFVFTAPVGTFRSNRFGLFDLIGNVCELCNDVFEPDYYKRSPTDDPQGPGQGARCAARSSHWRAPASFCRPAYRVGNVSDFRANTLGFRVAREVGAEEDDQAVASARSR